MMSCIINHTAAFSLQFSLQPKCYGRLFRMIHYAGSKISLDESINRFLNLKIRESNVKEDSGSYLIANNFNSMSYDLGMSHGRYCNQLVTFFHNL